MTENTDNLNFKDLLILKQMLEKGFRENFFSDQEIKTAEYEHKKLSIIDNFLELAKINLHNFHILYENLILMLWIPICSSAIRSFCSFRPTFTINF